MPGSLAHYEKKSKSKKSVSDTSSPENINPNHNRPTFDASDYRHYIKPIERKNLVRPALIGNWQLRA